MKAVSVSKLGGSRPLPAADRPPIWLVCSRRPSLAEFTALAREAAQRGQLVILLTRKGMTPPDFSNSADLVRVVCSDDLVSLQLGVRQKLALRSFGFLRLASRWLGRLKLMTAAEAVKTAEAVGRGYWLARFLSRQLGVPRAIAIPDDRDIRLDAGLLQFAKRHGVGTVTVNFGKSDARSDFGRRAEDETYRIGVPPARWLKAWMVRAAPRELFEQGGDAVVFTPPGAFTALWLVGGTLPIPWSYGGGRSDRVAVQNVEASDQLVAAGVAASRIWVTGQCTHDHLRFVSRDRERLRSNLYEKYGLDASRPLLICALPVLGEHNYMSQDNQRESTEFLLSVLSRSDCDVLLSLHPRQSRENYAGVAKAYGLSILDEPLSEVLPAADAFVAYSSTLEWAQLLGIPAVALEYFDLGFVLFANMPGIIAVTKRADLAEALKTVLSDQGAIAALKAQTESVRRSNRFDGCACARVLDVILNEMD